jgi:hypothetical protein
MMGSLVNMEQLVEWELGKGNRSSRRKPTSVSFCSPQIPRTQLCQTIEQNEYLRLSSLFFLREGSYLSNVVI